MQITNIKESILLESLYNLLKDIRKVVNYEKINPIYDEDNVIINKESKEVIISDVHKSSFNNSKLTKYSKIISYKLCDNGIDEDVVVNITLGLDFNKRLELDNKNEYTNKIRQLLNIMICDDSDIAKCQKVVDFYLKDK